MFLGHARTRGVFPGSGRFMCFLALLPVWYYGMELIPLSSALLLLSACSMATSQEETSTSQAGHRRGPSRDTPSTSSLISSLSMEELRSYCQIPNNFNFELSDGLSESAIDEEDSVVYFVGRGLLYLYLEARTLRLAIHVGLKCEAPNSA